MAATNITLIQNDTNYYNNNTDSNNDDEWRWPTKTTVFALNIEEQQLISTQMNKKKEKASRRKISAKKTSDTVQGREQQHQNKIYAEHAALQS